MKSTEIKALVLAGGKSSRMGTDKGEIIYYQKPQRYHIADMLESLGLDTYISVKSHQKQRVGYQYIIDKHEDIGPIAGILTAFETHTVAWLIIGCDYPLVDIETITELINNRETSKMATVYRSIETKHTIPTFGLYEATIYENLKLGMANKEYSLTRILKKNKVKYIESDNANLKSIDTPEESEKIKEAIG